MMTSDILRLSAEAAAAEHVRRSGKVYAMVTEPGYLRPAPIAGALLWQPADTFELSQRERLGLSEENGRYPAAWIIRERAGRGERYGDDGWGI